MEDCTQCNKLFNIHLAAGTIIRAAVIEDKLPPAAQSKLNNAVI